MQEAEYVHQLDRLWARNWPADLPREPHYPFGEIPITDYLRSWARHSPERAALVFYGTEISYQRLDELSDRFAALLRSRGVRRGDRVAVLLPNCPQFHVAFYGILKLGCVHVPVNPMFKEQELRHELVDSGARVIVTADTHHAMVESVRSDAGLGDIISTSPGRYLPAEPTLPVPESLLSPEQPCPGAIDLESALEHVSAPEPRTEVGLDDLAALNYTGGTTGLPKGCEHTQRHMVYTCATSATYNFEGLGPGSVVLTYPPYFWILGENVGVLMPVFTGATHVILGRWDVTAALAAIERYRVTCASLIIDNAVRLMECAEAEGRDLSSIRTVTAVPFGRNLTLEDRRRWQRLSGGRSVLRVSSYGMTETHSLDTFTAGLQDGDRDLTSPPPVLCGLPQPGTRFMIRDFETGEPMPLGAEGEIVISSPSVLRAYWGRPEASREVLRDGWLRTGDIGMLDENGFLHFMGRRKEMLKMSGMSVFPAEIELLLGQHPAVARSGVVGKPDPDKGEVPYAFVELDPDHGGTTTAEELVQWCRENIAGYKVPRIEVVTHLPMTTTGKVRKTELTELAARGDRAGGP
ncbi:acyl-CoA synthetase (AMP-forming)/AMP-acid ligase II [Lipingzhangella halophila]|uniref:Acyl-CoA synthetase (AMP-forming)/AMP-acid ligase II n=1 Tax=Lipingzhangella halophila TaxID=1783352 RepID=A0A7W7RF72_9ACTN|nr:AMP-binding protein [Lipingzhangella halophila]MBB4930903.1 acyl-CoA synthetase (AMP-forming)/AMP-acid ligase II [Lipingzhangella halophila]